MKLKLLAFLFAGILLMSCQEEEINPMKETNLITFKAKEGATLTDQIATADGPRYVITGAAESITDTHTSSGATGGSGGLNPIRP